MPTFHELTTTQLKQALQLREQIESLQTKLDVLLGGSSPAATPARKAAPTVKKRTMSAAGRAKIAAAQKARWAKVKGKSSPPKAPAKATSKRAGMTDERRAKLAASMRARWAVRKKAAGATAA